MEGTNPYQTPEARVEDPKSQQYGKIRIFSVEGRIGRLRYIGYSTGIPLLIGITFAVFLGVLVGPGRAEPMATPVMLIAGIAIVVVQILLTIQRCHDFNFPGWLAVLMFVPVANLILLLFLWLAPGTDGPNRFGNAPPPNSLGAVLLGLILPVMLGIAIAVAIAVPAYQEYLRRAQEAVQSR